MPRTLRICAKKTHKVKMPEDSKSCSVNTGLMLEFVVLLHRLGTYCTYWQKPNAHAEALSCC